MLVIPLGIAWFTALTLSLLDGRRRWVGWLAVAGLAASFAATLRLAVAVLGHGPLELVTGGWPAGVGIRLRADALGAGFAVLASGVLLVSLIYEALSGITHAILPALILFMNAGLTGLFLTSDAFNFYVFFEVSMTAGFVLASYGRDPRQARDALIFTVVNLLGSAMFLIGVVALYRLTGTLEMRQIAERIVAVDPSSVILIAALIFVAFSVKLGLFPFHFWLPAV
jgi:multicomponent Na+:H+ antiporter subunit D